MSPSTATRLTRRSLGRIAAATAVAAPVAGALAACSGEDDPNKITFLSWDNAEVMGPVIEQFEKDNPDYHVEVQYAAPVAGYIQKLQTQLGSNSATDVFIITAENKKQLMDGAFVQDQSGEPWASNLNETAVETYSRDGKLYGSAISSWAGGMVVNRDLVPGEFPADWDGFLDLCKQLKADGTVPYLEAVVGMTDTFCALLGQQNVVHGGTMDQQIWDGDLTFEEAWTPAVKAWYRLFEEGILDTSAAGLTGDVVLPEFQQGRLAVMTTGSWGISGISNGAPDLDFRFEAVPGSAGEPYWSGAVSPGLAINVKAKNPDAAKVFIEWMSTEPGVSFYQQANQFISTVKDYEPDLPAQLGDLVTAVQDGEYYLPAVSWIDNNDALSTEANALTQQLATGDIEPVDVGKAMDAKLASLR
ncbi:extracellular solute-binding protein [Glycomyces sp. NPDC047010]|uniref:ABC transporter substrate-binding protein n=1 Tax=Glycomyces sp. NPDC047010 TaxID=3155023 RepID=UPI0033CF8621